MRLERTTLVSLILLLLSLAGASAANADNVKKGATVMGTGLELTLNVTDPAAVEPAFAAVVAEMSRIEAMMSEWRDGSPVSLINRNAGKRPVQVPDELFKVIAAAQQVSAISNGAFDISWAAMRGLWNFAEGQERIPSDEEINKARRLIDYRKIELDEKKKTVYLKEPGMAIGLGGIAKGYAVDMAMQTLYKMGVRNAIVKAGGDMRVQGVSDAGPWEIGVKHPREKGRLIAKLKLSGVSISTSGDYERFFIKDGVLYHHIMDPKTGRPATGAQSVTILAPDTMTTDALSTAIFVMGPDEGMKLVERLNGVEAVIVDAQGRVHASSGIDLNLPDGNPSKAR
ncbi:MAG: FAD:protein FMN transferase [Deltaproteobacteria bacterium]|nr:FAD:protein FMN transferase [Deltaproteobacteria bacterium]